MVTVKRIKRLDIEKIKEPYPLGELDPLTDEQIEYLTDLENRCRQNFERSYRSMQKEKRTYGGISSSPIDRYTINVERS